MTELVAPLAGARIEILYIERSVKKMEVAPLAGARIEIVNGKLPQLKVLVAPLAGARIEIISAAHSKELLQSLPSRERGLKSQI